MLRNIPGAGGIKTYIYIYIYIYTLASQQKRCVAQFGAGWSDSQAEISVLGPFRENLLKPGTRQIS